MNDLLGSLLLWPIESAINELVLGRDPHVRALFGRFDGKSLAVSCREPELELTVRFEAQAVKIVALSPEALGIEADARVEGKLLSLLALLRQDADSRALADPALSLSGNVEFIQDLFQSLKHLDIRWSDYLAPVFGDVMAQGSSDLYANLTHFLSDAGRRLKRDLDDFIKEEARLTPHASERQLFQDELSELRLSLDRIEARMALLQSRLDTVSD